jgi:hypothetical protein
MTRVGKIARLPEDIRNELNRRLQDGEEGETLLAWLNGDPKVRESLARYYAGRPVTKQNLSEWRNGGYRDWLEQLEVMDLACKIADDEFDLAREVDGESMNELMAKRASMKLALVTEKLLAKAETPEEEMAILNRQIEQLEVLRKSEYRSTLREIAEWEHRWKREDRLAKEQAKQKRQEWNLTWVNLLGPRTALVLAHHFGGEPVMYWAAARMAAQSFGAKLDQLDWWARKMSGMPCPGSKEWDEWEAQKEREEKMAGGAGSHDANPDEPEPIETPKPKAKRKPKVKVAPVTPTEAKAGAHGGAPASPNAGASDGDPAKTSSPVAARDTAAGNVGSRNEAVGTEAMGTEVEPTEPIQAEAVSEVARQQALVESTQEAAKAASVAPSPIESNQNQPDYLEDAIGPNGEIDPLALLELRIKGKRQRLRAEEQMLMEAVNAEVDKGNLSDLIGSIVQTALPPSVLGGPS